MVSLFKSTHTPRGGATRSGLCGCEPEAISIHAPRKGCDAICCKLTSRATTYCRPNVTYLLDVVRFCVFYTIIFLFSRRTFQAFSHSFRFADVITLLNLLMDHSWFLLRILRFYCYIFSRGSIFADYLPPH